MAKTKDENILPSTAKPAPKPMEDLQDWLKRDEAILLLTASVKHNPRNFLILYLLLKTGRRVSELLELRVVDIDFDEGMILWNIKKKRDKHYRKWKAVDRPTINKIRDYVMLNQMAGSDYLFYSPFKGRKEHMTRQNVFLFLKKYCKQLGLNAHPHSFRHTFSVWLVQRMTSPSGLKILKDLLEHSDIRMTEHYLQFSTKETRDLLDNTFNDFG